MLTCRRGCGERHSVGPGQTRRDARRSRRLTQEDAQRNTVFGRLKPDHVAAHVPLVIEHNVRSTRVQLDARHGFVQVGADYPVGVVTNADCDPPTHHPHGQERSRRGGTMSDLAAQLCLQDVLYLDDGDEVEVDLPSQAGEAR